MARERLYHILLWSRDNKDLFLEKRGDRERFLKLLRKARKSGDLRVYAYCLLKDRLQFLCSCPTGVIEKILASVEGVYQSYCRSKYRDKAPVWERAVYECGWEGFLDLVRYVHRAPVRAEKRKGLWYRWSSHGEYLAGDDRWVDYRVVLSVYGKKDRAAMKRYKRFIHSPTIDQPITVFYQMDENREEGADTETAPAEDARARIGEACESAVVEEDTQTEASAEGDSAPHGDQAANIDQPAACGEDTEDENEVITYERVIAVTAELMEVSPASMQKGRGAARETAARRVALYVLKEEGHLTNAETGRVLGMAASTVSRTYNNAQWREELNSWVDQVKQRLHNETDI